MEIFEFASQFKWAWVYNYKKQFCSGDTWTDSVMLTVRPTCIYLCCTGWISSAKESFSRGKTSSCRGCITTGYWSANRETVCRWSGVCTVTSKPKGLLNRSGQDTELQPLHFMTIFQSTKIVTFVMVFNVTNNFWNSSIAFTYISHTVFIQQSSKNCIVLCSLKWMRRFLLQEKHWDIGRSCGMTLKKPGCWWSSSARGRNWNENR